MEAAFKEVYNRFKLRFYRQIFGTLDAAEGKLTIMEALTAEVIYALGRPTMSQLASVIGISAPNATYRVQSLVKKGYAERIPSPTDRREQRLQVTQKFKDFYFINEEYIDVVAGRMTRRFSPEDARRIETLLRVLADELMPETALPRPETDKTQGGRK